MFQEIKESLQQLYLEDERKRSQQNGLNIEANQDDLESQP